MRVSLLHFISWGIVPPTPIATGAGVSPVDDYIAQLRKARDDGFDVVWTPQLWREPDLLTVLALALHEVPDITVGTGVIPIQFRHPAVLAQQALTVNLISGGRLKLGIGMTHPMISEGMYGVPWDRHVRRLNEFLDGLCHFYTAKKRQPPVRSRRPDSRSTFPERPRRPCTWPRSAPKCWRSRPVGWPAR